MCDVLINKLFNTFLLIWWEYFNLRIFEWKKTGRRTDCIGSNSPPAAVTLVIIHTWPDHIEKIKRGVQRNRIISADQVSNHYVLQCMIHHDTFDEMMINHIMRDVSKTGLFLLVKFQIIISLGFQQAVVQGTCVVKKSNVR